MKQRSGAFCLAGFGLLGLLAWATWAQEQPVTLDQLPAAVKAAIQRESAGGQIREIEMEMVNGKAVYEAEVVRDGKTFDVRVAADGTLLGKEEEETPATTQPEQEQERSVKESEVPPAALATLQKLAGNAKFTEFAEEIEHGSKFYEGSWKTAAGTNVDALVTAAGDLVEIEEEVPADQVPATIREAVKKLAGADAKLFCEKKTLTLYEVKFRKGDERHEVLYTPDGRVVEKGVEKAAKSEQDKDD